MEATVLAIQQLYPQVFHACHAQHLRRRGTPFRLSERDSSILAHIGPGWATTALELGRHLGLGKPTMSAALQRLERLGYIARRPRTRTSPARHLELTALGQQALQATSVLDTARLTGLLQQLTPRQRAQAVLGLELLVRGARSLTKPGASS
jgi:DNA-binding MarR family transcriptional regulator